LGGIGKEYAADRVAAILHDLGIAHGLVDFGGDMAILGPHPDGTSWTIHLQDPNRRETMAATVSLGSGALATSGDYERYVEIAGRRYCHILDPRTG
jgi:FAD:protein FMN transferase